VYAELPGLEGVWANADTREAATEELREVLEDWILLRVSKGLSIPDIDGHTISVPTSV
jgi:predicted RNase H-like HicB family nuclease